MSTNKESIVTFYSPKFEQQCYLCQHGLHGTQQQAHSQGIIVGEPVVVYSTPEVIVSQTVGQPIPTKKGNSQANQINNLNASPWRDIQQQNQIQTSPTLIQTQQIKHYPIGNQQIYQIPSEQQAIHQTELKNSQQISTFYSGKYEEQCYLCQHGLHGKEVVTNTQNNVVYQTPEVIVSQNFGQPLTTRNTTTVQNFSQIINTPPRKDFVYSQQLQQSPIQNIQLNIPQNQQLLSTINGQQLQQSQIQNFQLNLPQYQQIISTTSQQLQQSAKMDNLKKTQNISWDGSLEREQTPQNRTKRIQTEYVKEIPSYLMMQPKSYVFPLRNE